MPSEVLSAQMARDSRLGAEAALTGMILQIHMDAFTLHLWDVQALLPGADFLAGDIALHACFCEG